MINNQPLETILLGFDFLSIKLGKLGQIADQERAAVGRQESRTDRVCIAMLKKFHAGQPPKRNIDM